MKRLACAAVLLVMAASCEDGVVHVGESPGNIYSKVVSLPEGRSVVCVLWSGRSEGEGGISCDWEHSK